MMNTIETPILDQVNKPEKFKSYKLTRTISKIIAYAILIILAVIWLYPILWIVVSSFVVQGGDRYGLPTAVPNE